MIRQPKNIIVSVNEHNSDRIVSADWIEGTCLCEGEFTRTDFVDHLLEEGIYQENSFANEWASEVWIELLLRQHSMGENYPFEISGRRICTPNEEAADYFFCLIVSLSHQYSWWSKKVMKLDENAYNVQGELFEEVVHARLGGFADGWKSLRTGFSSGNAVQIGQVAEGIAEYAECSINTEVLSDHADDKDGGLDVLVMRKYDDERSCYPTVFFQCASGGDWKTKLEQPNVDVWKKILNHAHPIRGFATPRCLSERKFRSSANRVQGVLLDRYRLFGNSQIETRSSTDASNWVNKHLALLESS